MLSKEEIEFNLKALSGVMLNFEDRLCDEMQERVKEVKEYIDNLESDKQKLIELLEKANKEDTDTVKYYEKQRRLTTDDFYKKSSFVKFTDLFCTAFACVVFFGIFFGRHDMNLL